MRAWMLAALAVAMAGPALAQDSMARALDLGTVLAAEEACGLSYDQEQIEAWIEENVADDDLSFASSLQTMTAGAGYQFEAMSESQRTAHCAQVRRSAAAHGFTG